MSVAVAHAPQVRQACAHDMPRILELRAMQEREFIGRVPVLPQLLWLVAEEEGVITAAAGGVFSVAPGADRTCIVTDFLDDGSLAGKRGLLAILDDAASANVCLYAIIPSDRPGLQKALASRGFDVSGLEMRKVPRAV